YRPVIERATLERIYRGLELILLGVAFKVLIADSCSLIVSPVFAHPQQATILASYLAAIAFSTQIYFDFLGYHHIARGTSLLFNIELPLNFNHPFSATNMSDFWERWHISLSRWIRDYLYVSVGGSRLGMPRTIFNLILVMSLAGAWHGAGWP